MTRIEFITSMCEAFITHHGYTPSKAQVVDFGILYETAMERPY